MPRPLLLATGNPHKLAELTELLADLGWQIKSLADFPRVASPVEDGESYEANAVKKAAYYGGRFGIAVLADDSGLEVDALGGAPGTLSARYAGPECSQHANTAKLLQALGAVPEPRRSARFVCCAALVEPDGRTHVEMGEIKGRIGWEPRGHNGFGYDPLFIPEGYENTFAELGPAVKQAISHRARAFGKMRAYLESLS